MKQKRKIASRVAWALLPAFVVLRMVGLSVSGEDLTPRWVGDVLQVSAPKVHFLTGKQLERLRNGASVPFDFQLTVTSSTNRNIALIRALERFVVSYDLWEEKFTVVRLRNSRKSGTHLTAAAAEAWCLDNIEIPTSDISSSKNLWIRLEIRTAEPKPVAPLSDDSGISLATLIEVFSRPTRNTQDHWALETGPFKLTDLRR